MQPARLIAQLETLDAPAKKIGKTVRSVIKPGPLKDALSGTWLGHALHPMLTDVTVGSFTSAVALDWLGGDESGAAAKKPARKKAASKAKAPPEPASIAARFLAERGVNAPAGSFYAIEASRHLGLGDTGGLRVGLAPYNHDEDVDRLLTGLHERLA